MADIDLSKILTPNLFSSALKYRLPWDGKEEIDFTSVTKCWFRGQGNSKAFREACYPALKTMSALGIDNILKVDLMSFLPTPESKEFPEQALGLVILLDQGPRQFFDGADERYCNGYFDPLCLKLSKQLLALPTHLRADTKQRWVEEMGYTFSYWVTLRFWFIAPIAHSEDLEDQRLQSAMVEENRLEVERVTGKQDPFREGLKTDMKDPTTFSRNAMGAPKGDAVKLEELVLWFLMIFDVHYPIIATFGRFPYRNGAMGRESTDAEKKFLEETNGFGMVDEVAAEKVREDVRVGRWSALGSE